MEPEQELVLKNRQKYLDQLAASFEKQVGSKMASEFELVEEWCKGKIRWRFERRKPVRVPCRAADQDEPSIF